MRIPRIFTALVIAALVIPTVVADTAKPKPEWRPLFNGKDLTGWTIKCKPADKDKAFWRVEDGAIVADSLNARGHDYVWLIPDGEYGDFTLKLKFQAFRDSPGNSGVQIRSRYDDQAGWLDGPQIDINPPAPWRTGMIWDETRGVQRWIFPDLPKGKWVDPSMAPKTLKFLYADQEPAWNELEITCTGNKVTAVLNGERITDFDGQGILDDGPHKERKVGQRGHVALQIHKGDRLKIKFKDIFLKEL